MRLSAEELVDLGLLKRQTRASPRDRDLEEFSATAYSAKKLVSKLYDIMLEESSMLSVAPTADVGESSFNAYIPIKAILELNPFRFTAPLEAMSNALEQYSVYTGGPDVDMTPKMLKDTYRDLFKIDLSDQEALQMIQNIQIDNKGHSTANRCEFVASVLARDGFGGPLIEDINHLWGKRPSWTACSVLYELGTGLCGPDLSKIIDTVYLAPSTPQRQGQLSKCAFQLLVAFTRDSTLRSFFAGNIQSYSPPKELEMEAFLGKEIFPHSDQANFETSARFDREVADLSAASDDDGDGSLSAAEFETFVWVVDMWRNLVPQIKDLEGYPDDVKPAASFLAERLTTPVVPEDPEFEKIWASTMGRKALFAPPKKLKEFLYNVLNRSQMPHDEHTVNMWLARHQQAKYFNHILKMSNAQISKEEFRAALYGHAQVTRLLSKEVVDTTLGMLMPAESRSSCDRACWLVLGPLLRNFAKLDVNADGSLSEAEFAAFGVTVLSRLGKNLAEEDKPTIYSDATEQFGTMEFGSKVKLFKLPAFVSLFRSAESKTVPVTLKEYLSPPSLTK